jgi:type I restriction enzyme S subunit
MMDWIEIPLGEFALETKSGFSQRPNSDGEGIPHLRPNNVSERGRIDLSEVKTITPEEKHKERYLLSSGDILFNNTNSEGLVGKTAYFDREGEFAFSNHMTRIRVPNEVANPRFVAAQLHWMWESGHLAKYVTRWVSQAAINQTELGNVPLKIPPPSEQQRIVDLLNRTDRLRRKRAQADALTKRILSALFYDMFSDPAANPKGWDKVQLGDLIEEGPRNGLYKPKSEYGEGTRILRIDGFYAGRIVDQNSLKRVHATDDEVEKYGLSKGDIVINRVNSEEYLGKSTIVPALSEPTLFESNMMRFSVDESRVNPIYLVEHLQSNATKAEILKKSKRAINQASINQQDVKSFSIALPPLDLQHNFAERARSIERLMKYQNGAGNYSERLLDVLLYRAFEGELTAQWRSDFEEELQEEQREQLKSLDVEQQADLFASSSR